MSAEVKREDAAEIINAKALYAMPEGDSGLVRERRLERVPSDQTSYTAGDVMKFVLSSQGRMIDPSNTYISFKLTRTGAPANTIGYLPIGVQGLFEEVKTQAWNGTVMEDLKDYNVNAALQDRVAMNGEDKAVYGSHEGFLPQGVDQVPWSVVGQGKNNTVAAQRAALHGYEYQLRSGSTFTVRLRHSGLWGMSQFIPLKQLGQISLEIKLAAVQHAFAIMKVGAGSTAVAAATNVETRVFESKLDNSAASLAIETIFESYTLSQVSLYVETILPSPAFDQSLDQAVANGGLPIYFPTYSLIRQTIDSAASSSTFYLQKAAANVTSVVSVQISTTTADKGDGGSRFRFFSGGCSSWQYQLGTEYYPMFAITDHAIGLREAIKSLPRKNASRPPVIPRWKYSHKNNLMANEAVLGAAAPAARYDYALWDQSRGDEQWQSDLFMIGARLQTMPGITLTGQSTNAGNQLILHLQFAAANGTVDANEKYGGARDLYSFIYYTRIIVVQPNNNVAVRE